MREIPLEVRNAIFLAAEGGSVHEMMCGSTMAQAKLIIDAAPNLEVAEEIARHYLEIMISALPVYWQEKVAAEDGDTRSH